MDEIEKHRWQAIVDSFELTKTGADPWDAIQLAGSFNGASHGEQCVIQFLLNLWESRWQMGMWEVRRDRCVSCLG